MGALIGEADPQRGAAGLADSHMSYSLHFSGGGYIGDYIGDWYGACLRGYYDLEYSYFISQTIFRPKESLMK